MSTKTESGPTFLDKTLLALAAAILVGGVVAYYMFPEQSVLVRTIGVLAGIGLAITVAMQSFQGKALWRFIQGSRIELRKVVWPNRQETVQTTIAVIIFAIVMALFFWLLDWVLLLVTQAARGM